MMRRLLPVLLLGGLLIGSSLIYLLTQHWSSRYLAYRERNKLVASACQNLVSAHYVVIGHDIVNPRHTTASRCDTITIVNTDDVIRDIAFGEHNNHQSYNGITEKVLKRGEGLSVVLNQTGTQTFHDHLNDAVQGDFTVTSN